LVCIKN
jgi:aman2_put: putative alpha-1,2-mannosidase